MDKSTTDQLEGAFHELKGKVKKAVGTIINDREMKAEGEAETFDGKVQTKVGQIEKVFDS
jgi:uncharacterized protein YjbJ (UPF0337 family)